MKKRGFVKSRSPPLILPPPTPRLVMRGKSGDTGVAEGRVDDGTCCFGRNNNNNDDGGVAERYASAEDDALRRLGLPPPPHHEGDDDDDDDDRRVPTVRDVRAAFRRAARGAHPDRPGGDATRFDALVRARDLLTTVPDFAPRAADRTVPVDVSLRDVCRGRVVRLAVTRRVLVHRDTGDPLDPRDVWRVAAPRLLRRRAVHPHHSHHHHHPQTPPSPLRPPLRGDAGDDPPPRLALRTVETPVELSLEAGVPSGGAWRVEGCTSHVPGLVPGTLVCPCRVRPDPIFDLVAGDGGGGGDLRIRITADPVDAIAGLWYGVRHPDGRHLRLRTEPGALAPVWRWVDVRPDDVRHPGDEASFQATTLTLRAKGYGVSGGDLVADVVRTGASGSTWPSTADGVERLCEALSARVAHFRRRDHDRETDGADDNAGDDNADAEHIVWLRRPPEPTRRHFRDGVEDTMPCNGRRDHVPYPPHHPNTTTPLSCQSSHSSSSRPPPRRPQCAQQ